MSFPPHFTFIFMRRLAYLDAFAIRGFRLALVVVADIHKFKFEMIIPLVLNA